MIKITVIAAGFANKGSKIITKEKKDIDDKQEVDIDKDAEDRDIPAFLRRGKTALPYKINSHERKKVPRPYLMAGMAAEGLAKRRLDQTSIHIIADVASKPESRLLQKGYPGVNPAPEQMRYGTNNPQLSRSNGLRDFNEIGIFQKSTYAVYYENLHTRVVKIIKIVFSVLKRVTEISLVAVLGVIAMIAFGIYKAGSIIRNWFQRMIY